MLCSAYGVDTAYAAFYAACWWWDLLVHLTFCSLRIDRPITLAIRAVCWLCSNCDTHLSQHLHSYPVRRLYSPQQDFIEHLQPRLGLPLWQCFQQVKQSHMCCLTPQSSKTFRIRFWQLTTIIKLKTFAESTRKFRSNVKESADLPQLHRQTCGQSECPIVPLHVVAQNQTFATLAISPSQPTTTTNSSQSDAPLSFFFLVFLLLCLSLSL